QIGPMKRREGGSEAATSFAALFLLALGAGIWLFEVQNIDEERGLAPFLLLLAGALLAAAWRWGYPLYAALGTAALLGAILYLPASGGSAGERFVPAMRI